jgi:hypothetical protein
METIHLEGAFYFPALSFPLLPQRKWLAKGRESESNQIEQLTTTIIQIGLLR